MKILFCLLFLISFHSASAEEELVEFFSSKDSSRKEAVKEFFDSVELEHKTESCMLSILPYEDQEEGTFDVQFRISGTQDSAYFAAVFRNDSQTATWSYVNDRVLIIRDSWKYERPYQIREIRLQKTKAGLYASYKVFQRDSAREPNAKLVQVIRCEF